MYTSMFTLEVFDCCDMANHGESACYRKLLRDDSSGMPCGPVPACAGTMSYEGTVQT